MYIWIIMTVVLILVATIVVLGIVKNRRLIAVQQANFDRYRAEVLQWIQAMKTSKTIEQMQACGPAPTVYTRVGLTDEVDEQRIRLDRRKRNEQFLRIRRNTTKKLNRIRNLNLGTNELFERLKSFEDARYLNSENLDWYNSQLRAVTLLITDNLLAKIRAGERKAFNALRELITDSYSRRNSSPFFNYTRQLFKYPEDWDALVVRYLATPNIDDFKNIKKEPAKGEVRLMAATALREQSLLKGQIVLAFCSSESTEITYSRNQTSTSRRYWVHRDEVGDVLLADVTKMVEAIIHSSKQAGVPA